MVSNYSYKNVLKKGSLERESTALIARCIALSSIPTEESRSAVVDELKSMRNDAISEI